MLTRSHAAFLELVLEAKNAYDAARKNMISIHVVEKCVNVFMLRTAFAYWPLLS